MDSKNRQQLIFGALFKWKAVCSYRINPESKAINILQLYLEQDLIDQNDLYIFLMKNLIITNDLKKWLIDQSASLITDNDIQKLTNSGLILDENSPFYSIWSNAVENMRIEETSIETALKIFSGDKLSVYLSNQSLCELINNYGKIPGELIKKHMLEKTHEIKDMDFHDILTYAILFGICDQITEWIEQAIWHNKYYIVATIVSYYHIKQYNDIIRHIISIYERITSESFELTDDKYMIYFGTLSSNCSSIAQSTYATDHFRKIYLIVHSFQQTAAVIYSSDANATSLKEQFDDMGETYEDFEYNQFADLSKLDEEVNKYNQLVQEIIEFMDKKLN